MRLSFNEFLSLLSSASLLAFSAVSKQIKMIRLEQTISFLLTKCNQSLLQLADELVASVQTFLQSDVLVREVGDATLQITHFLFNMFYVYDGGGGGGGHGN